MLIIQVSRFLLGYVFVFALVIFCTIANNSHFQSKSRRFKARVAFQLLKLNIKLVGSCIMR